MIALSGQGDRESVLEMLEAGAVGYLVKGGAPDAIIQAVRRAAAGLGSLSGEVATEVIEELVDELAQRRGAARRTELREDRIRKAIDDKSVLSIAFQPICTLRGELVAAEALARFDAASSRGPEEWFAEAAALGLGPELELAAVSAALASLPDLPRAFTCA